MLHDYFWSGAAIHLLLNTVAAVQMFLLSVFLFFHNIIKKDGNSNKCKQFPLSFQTRKSILKFLYIYRKNILGKQLSQSICSKYVFRLLHVPKFRVFSTKLNMMVQIVKLFTGVLWKSCSDEFYKKTPMRRSLF